MSVVVVLVCGGRRPGDWWPGGWWARSAVVAVGGQRFHRSPSDDYC